jgi:hypothetical protein
MGSLWNLHVLPNPTLASQCRAWRHRRPLPPLCRSRAGRASQEHHQGLPVPTLDYTLSETHQRSTDRARRLVGFTRNVEFRFQSCEEFHQILRENWSRASIPRWTIPSFAGGEGAICNERYRLGALPSHVKASPLPLCCYVLSNKNSRTRTGILSLSLSLSLDALVQLTIRA